jgi:Rieske Fe-S protein
MTQMIDIPHMPAPGSRRTFLLRIGAAASAGAMLPLAQSCVVVTPAPALNPFDAAAKPETSGSDAATDTASDATARTDAAKDTITDTPLDATVTTDTAPADTAPVDAPPVDTGPACPATAPATKLGSFDISTKEFAALETIGGLAGFSGGGKNVLLIRTGPCEVVGVDALCTHDGCDMRPDPFDGAGIFDVATGLLKCACHGSKFDKGGKVKQGPAKKALTAYTVAFDGKKGEVGT